MIEIGRQGIHHPFWVTWRLALLLGGSLTCAAHLTLGLRRLTGGVGLVAPAGPGLAGGTIVVYR